MVRLCSLLILSPFLLCLLSAEAGNGGRKVKKIFAQIRKAHISCKFGGPDLFGIGIFFFKLLCQWLSERAVCIQCSFSQVVHLLGFVLFCFCFCFSDKPQILPLLPQSSLILVSLSRLRCLFKPPSYNFSSVLYPPTAGFHCFFIASSPQRKAYTLARLEVEIVASVFSALLLFFLLHACTIRHPSAV